MPAIGEDTDRVAVTEDGLFVNQLIRSVRTYYTADHHLLHRADMLQFAEVHVFELRVIERYVHTEGLFAGSLRLFLQSFFLFRQADLKRPADEFHRQNNPHYTERISDGIAGSNIRIGRAGDVLISLLRRSQGGRRGSSTGEDSGHGGHVNAGGVMEDDGANASQKDDSRSQHIELQHAAFERRERRSNLQADGIDKENESKILGELRYVMVNLNTTRS